MAGITLHTVLDHLRRLHARADAAQRSDRELLHAFVTNRDQEAFAVVVRRHAALVWGVCRRILGHPQDAEDAFQATFLILARRAGSVRWRPSVGGWLHTVAQRLAVRLRRQAEQRRAHEQQARRTPVDSSLPELAAVVDEELQRLPAKYREPLLLHYWEGMTAETAARQLGLSRALFYKRLNRGRDMLRERLHRQGLSLAAPLLAAVLTPEAEAASHSLIQATLHGVMEKVPERVAILAAEALGFTVVVKLKIGVALVLLVGIAAGGVAVLTPQTKTPTPQAERPTDPPQAEDKSARRVDRYGDPLPPGAIARLGTVRFRPGDFLAHIAFSPDGKLLAVAALKPGENAESVSLSLWDRASGRRLRKFGFGQRPCYALSFSPDGKTLASQDARGEIYLWDLKTGKELRRFKGELEPLGIGPGSTVAGAGFVFSPDGKSLAARGADKAIHLWEIAGEKELQKLEAVPEDYSPLAFSRDGKILATSAEKMIRLWDAATGKEKARLTGHEHTAGTPAFSADGKTFAALARTPGQLYQVTAYVWDIAAAKLLHKWDLPANPVFASCMSPDGKLVLVGSGGNLCLHDLSTGKQLRRLSALFTGATAIFSAVFSPDGKTVAAGGLNCALQLWDVESGKPLLPFVGHQGGLNSLALSTNDKYLASTGDDNRIFLWDMTTAQPIATFQSPRAHFVHAAFAPDDRTLAVVGEYPFVRVLEVPSGKEIRRFPCDRDRQNSVAFSPDGQLIAAGSGDTSNESRDKNIRLWETSTGKLLHKIPVLRVSKHDGGILCLAFSPDGLLLASGGYGEAAHLWNAATGQLYCQLPGHYYWVSSICFSPDGQMLATPHRDREKRTIRLWEVRSGKERGQLVGHTGRVNSLAFAPDGRLASAGDDKTIRIWDLNTGAETACFRGHESVVGPLAFSSDGQRLVSGSWDTTILVWDMKSLPQARFAKAVELSAKELEAGWADLADADASKAFRTIRTLIRARQQSVSFLKKRLRPIPPTATERIAAYIADLDSDRFETRSNAEAELEKLEELAEPALRRALQERPSSLELRRRLEALLQRLEGPITSSETLRQLRAVEVLEHINSPEARRLLEQLAKGAPEARLTREAKASLRRLDLRK